jgi:hypothetical protein
MQGWQIENCVLYVAAAATIIGSYYLGAGGLSWFGLVFLLMVNLPSRTDENQVFDVDF